MALHDWTDRSGWEGLHIFWMTEIARGLRAELPEGYRAKIGSSPQPEVEVLVATVEEDFRVLVERDGRLVAAIELISPCNKDRPVSREQYASRYINYLHGGVNLLLVDVHRRPLGFSFAQSIAANLDPSLPAAPAPAAVSYRLGGPAAQGGRMLAAWQHPLAVGEPLPTIWLALSPDAAVEIDLDATYSRAAADCYVA